jgi:hypothetical protein
MHKASPRLEEVCVMTIRMTAVVAGLAAIALPALASAQMGWVPGAEIVGHSAQVETNGVTNTVYFDAGGAGRIVTPGGTTIPATWTAANGQLCLYGNGGQECWPYQAPFQAGQQVTLTSSCQATSRWMASATNPLPQPPQSAPGGERG